MTTDFPIIMGYSPPNVLPEEILSDHPQRIRSVICCGSNPLRSYADTSVYEKAFARLDLLVCIDLAMTETARLAHYVLPARRCIGTYLAGWRQSFNRIHLPSRFTNKEPKCPHPPCLNPEPSTA